MDITIKEEPRFNEIIEVSIHSGITPDDVDTLLDMVDMNGDGIIMPDEFAKVVMAGANTYFFDNVADTFADGGIAI